MPRRKLEKYTENQIEAAFLMYFEGKYSMNTIGRVVKSAFPNERFHSEDINRLLEFKGHAPRPKKTMTQIAWEERMRPEFKDKDYIERLALRIRSMTRKG